MGQINFNSHFTTNEIKIVDYKEERRIANNFGTKQTSI